jgi:hypothetical protein
MTHARDATASVAGPLVSYVTRRLKGAGVGHPANVVLYKPHPHHPSVSPIVYCYWGGETLLNDLAQIIREGQAFGVGELALSLAVHWLREYGLNSVAVWNLDTPGLADGLSLAESYPIHLAFVRRKVETDPQWFTVDLAEYRVTNLHGVWALFDEQSEAEPGDAPDTGRM